MPLGTAVSPNPAQMDHIVRPTQLPARWRDVISATGTGGVDTQDAAAIQDPTTDITNEATSILNIGKQGTTLRLRMRYDTETTANGTDLVVRVFGRWRSEVNSTVVTDEWETLENKAGSLTATFTPVVATDLDDGASPSFSVTQPDPNNHAWDLNGCNQVLVGVETAYSAGSGGASATASLQAKVI